MELNGNQTFSTAWGNLNGLLSIAFDSLGNLFATSSIDNSVVNIDCREPAKRFRLRKPDCRNRVNLPTAAFDYTAVSWSSNYFNGTVGKIRTTGVDCPSGIRPCLFPVTSPLASVGLAFSRGYTTNRFAAPVANPRAGNRRNAGRLYPVKWQMTNPDGSLVTSLSHIVSTTYQTVSCSSLQPASNTLSATTTTSSGLLYNSGANQFTFTWATPRRLGAASLRSAWTVVRRCRRPLRCKSAGGRSSSATALLSYPISFRSRAGWWWLGCIRTLPWHCTRTCRFRQRQRLGPLRRYLAGSLLEFRLSVLARQSHDKRSR